MTTLELIAAFCVADDALTYHERPFYRACAGGAYFERTPEWERKRAQLLAAWYAAYYAAWPERKAESNPRLKARMLAWLRG